MYYYTVVQQIQGDIADVLAMPEVRETLQKQGADTSGMSTSEFEAFINSEREKFRIIVQAANIDE